MATESSASPHTPSCDCVHLSGSISCHLTLLTRPQPPWLPRCFTDGPRSVPAQGLRACCSLCRGDCSLRSLHDWAPAYQASPGMSPPQRSPPVLLFQLTKLRLDQALTTSQRLSGNWGVCVLPFPREKKRPMRATTPSGITGTSQPGVPAIAPARFLNKCWLFALSSFVTRSHSRTP